MQTMLGFVRSRLPIPLVATGLITAGLAHGRQRLGMVPGLVWRLPGGGLTDPQGPATNPIGWKVIRVGA
jgi:hypothetical protein